MRLFLLLSMALGVLAVLAQPATVGPETVVLTVHGRKYTKAEFEEIAKQQNSDPKVVAERLSTANGFARVEALAEEARRRKLDKNPEVQAKLAMYTGSLLNQALFNDILAEITKDESIARKRYETSQSIAEERRLRQILLRCTDSKPVAGKLTPEEALRKAEEIRAKILAGAKFDEMARTYSVDERTKAKGGDMDLVRKAVLTQEFGEVAFQLKTGEVSKPVKSTYGYHLILVEKIVPPEFGSVRKSLEYEIARERIQAIVVSGIQLNPDYFGK